MPLPLIVPIIGAGVTLIGSGLNFFSSKKQTEEQKKLAESQLDYQKWLAEEQIKSEKESKAFQQSALIYVGLFVAFILLLILIAKKL